MKKTHAPQRDTTIRPRRWILASQFSSYHHTCGVVNPDAADVRFYQCTPCQCPADMTSRRVGPLYFTPMSIR